MRRVAAAVALCLAAGPATAGPLDDALARARRADRALVVEFRADWCGPCHVFEKSVLATAWVKLELRRRIFVSIDIDQPDGAELAKRYRILGVPSFLSLDPSGEVLQHSSGLMDVFTPSAFIAFFDRAESRREYRKRGSDPRIARFAAGEAVAVRRAPGTARASWALARAAIAGRLPSAERSALFDLHARYATSERQLAFTIFAALAAGSPEDAELVADRLLDRDPIDGAALAAAGHAYLEANRGSAAYRLWRLCADEERSRRVRLACRTLAMRMMFGRPPGAIELVRHAVRLRVLAKLGSGERAVAAAERAAEDAIWGLMPAPALARERSGPPEPPGVLWFRRGLVTMLAGFRSDAGPSGDGRFQLDARALLAANRGADVKPMALATGSLGIDFADQVAYHAAAQIGFAAAGGLVGIYSGLSASDHGAAGTAALGTPIELALFLPGARFGGEAFVRTTILFAGDPARRDGSNDAPIGADELSIGATARIPGLGAPFLVGIRHDQFQDRTLTGLWLGIQLAP